MLDTESQDYKSRRQFARSPCDIVDVQNRTILNLSEGGLYLESHIPYEVDQVIPLEFRLTESQNPIQASGAVRYKRIPSKGTYGYGISFTDLSETDRSRLSKFLQAPQERLATESTVYHRTPRRQLTEQLRQHLTVMLTIEESSVAGRLCDFNEYGCKVIVPDDLFFEMGDVVELHISISHISIFKGSVAVKHVHKDSHGLICGIQFLDATLDIDEVDSFISSLSAARDVEILHNEISEIERIDPSFKVTVCDFRVELETIKKHIENCESILNGLPRNKKDRYKAEFIDSVESYLHSVVHNLMLRVYAVVRDFSVDQHAIHRWYFQKSLLHLTTNSIFFRRALEKPRGYAGDYQMMNILLSGLRQGNTLWEKIINSCLTSIPLGNAVRERAAVLKRKLLKMASLETEMHILSLACGPAYEVQEFFKDYPGNNVVFYLVDQDRAALAYTHKRLTELNLKRAKKIKFYLIERSIKQVLKDPHSLSPYPMFHYIYASGLYDYLPDRALTALTRVLYDRLAPNAEMTVGNFSPSPYGYFIEYASDWFLILRSTERLLKLVRPVLSEDDMLEIQPIAEKVFLFLHLRKNDKIH